MHMTLNYLRRKSLNNQMMTLDSLHLLHTWYLSSALSLNIAKELVLERLEYYFGRISAKNRHHIIISFIIIYSVHQSCHLQIVDHSYLYV
jgi:hypothetical protein